MKRVFGFLLTVLCISLWGTSNINAQEKAIYIYRNDGEFNAFFRDEVLSIEYSNYDLDSVYHDDVVVQDVYTEDSIYRIPLAAIDSVGFVQPETIYNGQVVRMEPMLPYIISVDGLVVTFSSDIPSSLIPKVGDVLLHDSFDSELMPEGFAGRVVQCSGQQVVCESVSFEDIYEQIVCYGKYTAVDDETSSSMRLVPRRVAGHISTAIDIGGTLGSTGSGLYGSLNGRLGLDLCVTFKYNKGMDPYFDLSVSPNMRIKFEAGVKGSFSKNFLSKKENLISLPIPDTPFLLKLKAGPALTLSLKASVTITTEASLGYKFGVKYEDGEFKGYGQNTSKWFSMPDVSGSISGSIFAGVQTEFGIFSYGDLLSLSIEKEAGAEFVANLTEDLLASDKYEELQNAQFDLNLKASVGVAAKAQFFKWVSASANWTLLSGQLNINSWKLVPKFQKPIVTVSGSSSAIISVKPSEKLLFPVSVGVGVWDNSGNLQDAQYCADTYRILEDWPHAQYQAIVSNLSSGQNYNAYPLVKLFGAEIKATPSEAFQTITMPVRITRFNQTNSEYSKNAFTNDGVQYSYKYDCEVTVTLDDATDVADWGYVYEDPYGNLALISLKSFASPYTDTRYSYYRNEPESYARLYGYVKYYGDDSFYHGEKTDYPLIYDKQPEATTLEPTCIDETWATIKCAYKESAPWNGICGVEYWKDNDHKEILFELAQDKELEISLTGLSPNTVYYYCAFIKIDDRYIYAEDTQTIKTSQAIISICPDGHHPHLIDLGLPSGTKWQCCNVDAPSPLEAGGYYAWGETYEKAVYNRYTHSGDVVISDSHDIAYVVSNGQTRMPTHTQIQEILNNCSWTWESHNGVLGAMVTASNGNAIFLPAASFKDSNRSDYLGAPFGTYGSYWGRDLGGVVNYGVNPTLVGTELIFGILDGNIGFVPSNFYYTWGNTGWVYCGRSIRPVSAEAEPEYEFTLSTQEPVKVDAETAIVSCYFKGFREKNGVCGVQYWDDDNTYEVTIDATEDGVQEILLEGLTANTQYSYRAFVQIGNINIYADEILMFKTNTGSYPGSNHPQK